MLETLYVKDFAIVEAAQIAFGAGMTAVTGETGAGKSLLVDALLLLGGRRADAGVVRHGSERAELAADFALGDAPAAAAWLVREAFDEGDACQLRRVVRAEGGSRAWINGRPASLGQLQALAQLLIEIHGQHEHQNLLDRTRQLALLDAFGDHADALRAMATLAWRWREIGAEIHALGGGEDNEERIRTLESHVADLELHALGEADLDALDDLHKRLSNAGQLLQVSGGVAELLDGESELAAARAVARARAEIERLSLLDGRLAPVAELLAAAGIQLAEAVDTLARYRDALELDPERLAQTEARLSKLHELSRRHRLPVAALLPHARQLREELDRLRGAGSRLRLLQQERARIESEYATLAPQVGHARRAAGERLSHEVDAVLADLGMTGAHFEVQFETTGKTQPDAHGAERAEFLVSANPGQPPRALRKVASGGELSRISLAIEVAALGLDDVATMVFDEVDAGIGGAVAEVVGRKLRKLGGKRQVLCVTHLPQVAAQAHAQIKVAKSSAGDDTRIRIQSLKDKDRREEIARMLGGVEITRETQAHARQMLQAADAGD